MKPYQNNYNKKAANQLYKMANKHITKHKDIIKKSNQKTLCSPFLHPPLPPKAFPSPPATSTRLQGRGEEGHENGRGRGVGGKPGLGARGCDEGG